MGAFLIGLCAGHSPAPEGEAMAPTAALASHRHNRPVAILLVDSNDDTREMYAEFFRQCGSEVEEAQDGRQALAIALTRVPDVVVTGKRLPGMSGLDLCRLLRQDLSTFAVPIVLLTDVSEEETRRGLRAGATTVLGNPCLPDSLINEVRRLLQSQDTGRASHSLGPETPSITTSSFDDTTSSSDDSRHPTQPGQRRAMLNHSFGRGTTTEPSVVPPTLACPSCFQSLRYLQSYIGGVSARLPEQWDYYQCETGCGTFQYRHRTRKLRQIE